MKFLCVPCDSPMTLQTVGPPEGGSLSIVYSCPECGYEMAMLTNAYETQMVQSLGVRIGPATTAAAPGTSGARCPFTAMIPGSEEARPVPASEPPPVRWTAAAEAGWRRFPSSSARWRAPASSDSRETRVLRKSTKRSSTRRATSSACSPSL